MRPTNQYVIDNYKHIDELSVDIEERRDAIAVASKKLNDDEELLIDCKSVWKVIDGIALYHDGRSTGAVDKTITKRSANFYVNVNDREWWGLCTYDDQFGHQGEIFHGANWPTEKDVLEASIQWVLNGTIPQLPVEYQL